MYRFYILSFIIGFCSSASVVPRTTDKYHLRHAPQDPVVYSNNGNYVHDSDDYNIDNGLPSSTTINYREVDELEKAKSAHYSFDASVKDDINDHSHVRTEERNGLKVRGMYSYSDGFFYRTVHYEADENGYRVVKEDVKKIGNGPQFNPGGRADVSGSLLNRPYSIMIDNDKAPHYVEFRNAKRA